MEHKLAAQYRARIVKELAEELLVLPEHIVLMQITEGHKKVKEYCKELTEGGTTAPLEAMQSILDKLVEDVLTMKILVELRQ